MSIDGTDPSILFVGTTWVSWGEGRVPVGYKADSDGYFYYAEQTGGEMMHILTTNEIPYHAHGYIAPTAYTGDTVLTVAQIPSHNHPTGAAYTFYNQGTATGTILLWGESGAITGSAGGNQGHNHTQGTTQLDTGAVGANYGHNNLQPYIVCYMWKRIS